MQRLLIICLLMCCFSVAFAQKCGITLKGKIIDSKEEAPIAGATLQILNLNKSTITNLDGEYIFENLCRNASVTIEIRYITYETKKITFTLTSNSIKNITLIENQLELDEVVIKADRLKEKGTETISQITLSTEEIRAIPTETLGTTLSKIEGVSFASTGTNVQIPIIHGLSGNRILVLNNGIKHGFQNWGNAHAPEIDINAVNKITVVKGAGGVRFGPEALAGVIMTEPNSLRLNNNFYGNIGVGFESNGLGGNTNFEIGQGKKNWSYFLNGSFTKIGDRFAPGVNLTDIQSQELSISGTGATEQRINLSNTGKEEYAFGLGARHSFDEWTLRIHYSFIDQNLGLLRASFPSSTPALIRAFNSPVPLIINDFTYDITDPRETTQHHLTKAEVDWKYTDDARLNFRAGIQLNKRQEFAVRRNAERPIIDLDLLTLDYQLEWEHPEWKGLNGFMGLQYFSQNNDNNPGTFSVAFIPNYNTYRFGIFAVEKVKFGQNTLEAGVRFDTETNDIRVENNIDRSIVRDRYTFSNFTASLGYQWKLSNNSSFKTNIGSAFRTPNVAELYSFGQSGFYSLFGLLRIKADENGNLNANEIQSLDESDVNKEIGYKLTNEFNFSNDTNAHALTTYINYIQNFVFNRPIGVTQTFSRARVVQITDQQDALFLGLDYTWKREFSKQLSTTYGLSYLWSRNVEKNEPLINQPPISTNLQLDWNQGKFWFFERSKWTLRPSYTFRQFQAPRVVPLESVDDGSTDITLDSEIFDFIDAPDGYFLLDASWNFQKNNFRGSVAVQNILNTNYRNYLNELRYFADEPGINFVFSANYSF